jgi:hypothetical protein
MLDPTRALLMVTDIQGNLALAMHDRERLYRNIGIVIQGFRLLDIPVMWIEQYPEGLGPTVPEVARHLMGFVPIPKRTFSSLREPAIEAAFAGSGRDQVVLVGIEAHVCITQTALDLLGRGVETHVVADAVSSRTPENVKLGLDRIRQAGGQITGAEMCLFELQRSAGGETFKRLLALVK